MKPNLIAAAFTATLCLSGAAFAQSNVDQPSKTESFTHGESKRCESMTGSAKEQCDKEEATKAEGPETADAQRPGGSSSAAGASGAHFTHGESKHCETMTGAAKEQCDKQEATK